MTVKTNTLKPDLLQAHESDFGTSIAQSLWDKVANYHNWTNSSIPVGYLLFFYGAQTLFNGVFIEPPNPNLWVLCNGDLIDDVDSPLHGQYAPDLREKFLKGGNQIGDTGGQTTINLNHDHGTTLVPENDESGHSNARMGGNYVAGALHTHVIGSQWSSAEPILPPFREVQIYLRKK